MKKAFILVFLSISLFITSLTSTAADLKIGLIDEARLLSEYDESKKAQEQIAKLREQIQTLLNELSADLEKVNSNKNLSATQKQAKQKEAEDKLLAEKDKSEEIANSLREKVETKIQKAVDEEAKAQGLTLVLSKETTFFGGKDITNAILNRLESLK